MASGNHVNNGKDGILKFELKSAEANEAKRLQGLNKEGEEVIVPSRTFGYRFHLEIIKRKRIKADEKHD